MSQMPPPATTNVHHQSSPRPLTTTITRIEDTLMTASNTCRSSGSSGPMFSSGEQTVIRIGHESASSGASSCGTAEACDDIPPTMLMMLNHLYIGLNYYDTLAREVKSLDFSGISNLCRSVIEDMEWEEDAGEEAPKEEHEPVADSQAKIARIAAKYVRQAKERDQEKAALQAEVGKKMDYINEMLQERLVWMQSKLQRFQVQSSL